MSGPRITDLGCVFFGWKWFQEIIFTLFRMFGCHGKWYFPENDFRLTNIFTFDRNDFLPSFSLQSIFGKRERERERARARERGEETEQSVDLQSELQAARSREDHDLAIDGTISRRREIAIARLRRRKLAPQIAIDGAILRHRKIAISDRDR